MTRKNSLDTDKAGLFKHKVLDGFSPSDDEWDDFLCQIHREQPACSALVFADTTTNLGLSSYELLSKEMLPYLRSDSSVLDLGTGSGFFLEVLQKSASGSYKMIGLDMSSEDLALAHEKFMNDPNIRFVHAKAQNIPLSDDSVDLVSAHMSLMMMKPIEPVIKELNRVLKKGGRVFAVTPSAEPADGLQKQVSSAISTFFKNEFPNFKTLPTGELRTRDMEGLKTLFFPLFSTIEFYQNFEMIINVTPNNIWEYCRTLASINILPDSKRIKLKEVIEGIAGDHFDPQKGLTLQFPLAVWSIQK